MTLDEAIEHSEEVAEEKENFIKFSEKIINPFP